MPRRGFRSYNPGRDTRWGTAHGGNPPAWWLFQRAQTATPAVSRPEAKGAPQGETPASILRVLRVADGQGLLNGEIRTAAQMIGLSILWGEKPPEVAVARVAAVVPEVAQLLELLNGGDQGGPE